jgi:hypothetical protein
MSMLIIRLFIAVSSTYSLRQLSTLGAACVTNAAGTAGTAGGGAARARGT